MSFVSSLLQAIVRLDGEAVVLHVGEKPYIVTPTDQVDLATKGLTVEAATGILNQLLPPEPQNALEEFGAVQYQMSPNAELPGEHFTIVAARGGDDIWIEIRRRQVPDEDRVPLELFAPPQASSEVPASNSEQKPLPPSRDRVAIPLHIPEAPASPESPEPVAAVRPSQAKGRPAPVRSPVPFVSIAAEPAPPPASDPAPVVPLTRSPIRAEAPPPLEHKPSLSLEQVLRQAAARGASALYLSSGARPAIRIDGEIETLDGAPVLDAKEVEGLLLTLMPERDAEALRTGAASEWICDIADLGRVRCLSLRDSRGPGGVFRLMRPRGVSAEQLGLPRQIQGLALERDGLVLVAGARASGKRTLISAFVDLINRQRHDHVVTIEGEINVTHDRVGALVSQREVRGGTDEMLAAARTALREDPDVLVLENVRTPELMHLALDAAATGHLVIGGLAAASATGAVDRIIDLYPPELRRPVQLSLAHTLRGVVAQVLLKKKGGGRVAAREVLLNTPAVRSALAEGKTSQLPLAIEGGRSHGMTPLNDALVGFVQGGVVDVREAYRHAVDRPGFLALLKQQGLDISAIEKYA
jgi:twitching motility protein PilT